MSKKKEIKKNMNDSWSHEKKNYNFPMERKVQGNLKWQKEKKTKDR